MAMPGPLSILYYYCYKTSFVNFGTSYGKFFTFLNDENLGKIERKLNESHKES